MLDVLIAEADPVHVREGPVALGGHAPPARPDRPSMPLPRLLTAREREVLRLLVDAKSNKDVAALLGISVKTVETHRAAIMRKLGARSIVEVVRFAIRTGLVGA